MLDEFSKLLPACSHPSLTESSFVFFVWYIVDGTSR